MEKKFWGKTIFALAVAAIMTGCSSDDKLSGDEPNPIHPNDAVYLNIVAKLPTATGGRSQTNVGGGSTGGVEIGDDNENRVRSMMLVFADNENKIIAYGVQDGSATVENGKTNLVSSTQKIDKSTLGAYYGGENGVLDDTKRKINVWLFCNPTERLKTVIADAASSNDNAVRKGWIDAVCTNLETPAAGSASNAAIWGGPDHSTGFLMTSAEAITKTLPKSFKDWDHHSSPSTAFKLSGKNHEDGATDQLIDNSGAIKVERAVARFDFRDGSKNGDNTYDIVTENSATSLQIQLKKMALVNMSKNFHFIRRVSDNGLPSGDNFKVGGVEYDDEAAGKFNYVVDTDADDKANGVIGGGLLFSDYFNFCLFHVDGSNAVIDPSAREQWYTSKIDDVLSGREDNDEGWTPDKNVIAGYHVWRYVTENTIPGPVANQQTGITTGVVFKGKMVVPDGTTGSLADAVKSSVGDSRKDAILYTYANDIYVTWKEVRAAALAAGKGSDMYTAAFGTPSGNVEPVAGQNPVYSNDATSADYMWNLWHNQNVNDNNALLAFKNAATAADFTLYESSKDEDYGPGYYCYYYYWNRHNDNGNNGVMGPMEFAVVRNNVYKLAVTNIRRLGHPRVSENDPDPVDPDDPDEEGNIYFDVQSETLPWVVRVNNIEF